MSPANLFFAELTPMQLILILLIVTVVIFALLGLKIVRHSETIVIERLGRYHRTLNSGINIIWPLIDRARAIHWRYTENGPNNRVIFITRTSNRIDLRETVYDFPRQNVITRDNVQILINALVYFQITDPMKSVYEISNLPDAIEKLTQTTLRNVIGEMDFDTCLVSRDTVNKKLGLILCEATHKWRRSDGRMSYHQLDHHHIVINSLFYFQITGPMKPVYEISNLPDAIEKLTQTTLRNVIGEMDFDTCLVSRDTVNKKLGLILDDATHKWG